MRRMKTALGAGLLLTVPAYAWAQDYDLAEITIYSNAEETELEKSGSTVEVVTKKDLQATGETRVADYLSALPGISVTTNGGIGNATSLRVRGLSGRYLGVYVDGIDVNDPASSQISFDFGSLMTSDVSRIEVLKGTQSALYGSEAIGGVINITTNRATENGTFHSVELEYGSYDTVRSSYNLSTKTDRAELAFTLSHLKTDGFSAADENAGNTEADGHESKRLSFSGAYNLSDTVRIGMSGFWQDSSSQYDEYAFGVGPVDGATPDETSDATSHGLRVFADIDGGAVRHTLSASYYEMDRESHGTNAWGAFSYPYLGRRKTIAYKGVADLTDTMTLSFGADYSDETSGKGATKTDHQLKGIFAELNYAPNAQLDVVASVRHDDHSEFGGETTGRLAMAYRPREDVILRFAAGTGFRTPSLFELYDPFYGNAALKPETSTTMELGIEKTYGDGSFARLTGFYTEIDNLIDWTGAGYGQIDGKTKTKGVELSGALALSDRISLGGSFTFTDAKTAAGARQSRVPKTELALNLNAQLTDRLSGVLTARHVTGVVDGGVDLDDYTVVGLNLAYDLTDNAQAYLRVENLLDEEYQTINGYGQSDRAYFFGLRANF